MTCWRLSMS